ncbi:MAG: HEAT repeat domain-containing protein [Pseudomonadota bacterium]
MGREITGGRALKKRVLALLDPEDFDAGLAELVGMPGRQVINPLFSFLLNEDEKIRWRAVEAMGAVIAHLADSDMEGARIAMRRLMWSLNDESGGIGWGAPEVMAEAMTGHKALAGEFLPVYCSYADKDGNYLEYEALQRGLLWGVIRLALHDRTLTRGVVPHLPEYLKAVDPAVRGLGAWAAGVAGAVNAIPGIKRLIDDEAEFRTYMDRRFHNRRVKDTAREALALLENQWAAV